MTRKNPFTPSFGKVPPFMAGRDDIVERLMRGFDNGSGDPNLTTIFVGARGTGKTALLTRVSREVRGCGWISVDVSARPGMLEDIVLQAKKEAAHIIESEGASRLAGVQVGQLFGIEWEREPASPANWRMQMEQILDQLSERKTGLLITVDEVRPDLDEMIDLVSVYQHFVREDRDVALLMAGLPFKVSELLANEDISFLRRAQHRYFGRIPDMEIFDAFERTVRNAGRSIKMPSLDVAVDAIDGFPYMMQLAGYHAWERNPQVEEVTLQDVQEGVTLAQKELAVGVYETTFRELSKKDREFLYAMIEDEDDSFVVDIAKRMGVKANYAGQYKRRLLEQGVIGERGRNAVGFELPAFKDYLLSKL